MTPDAPVMATISRFMAGPRGDSFNCPVLRHRVEFAPIVAESISNSAARHPPSPPIHEFMANFPFRLASPLLHLLDPEAAHGATIWALKRGLAGAGDAVDDPILATRAWNLEFKN